MELFRRGLRRLAEFLEALDGRNDAQRALLVCLLAIAFHIFLTASFYAAYTLTPPTVVATRNVPYGRFMSHVLAAGLVLYLLEYALLRFSLRRPRWRTFAVYFLFQTIGTIQFFVIQALGTYSTAMMMFFPVDVAIVFLLFDWRKALFVLIYGGLLFTCIGIAEHLGHIPYAPLIHEALRPPPPPAPALAQEIFFIWMLTTLLYLILYFVHDALQRANKRLRETKDQLVRSESLATVGSLVTGAAHELRNPLASSRALLQSLLEDLEGRESISGETRQEAIHAVRMALEAEGRAKHIVDRLYELSDDLAHASSLCRLSTLLDNLARRFSGTEISCNGIDFATQVRERPLTTILGNLLKNAWEAGGKRPPSLNVILDGDQMEFSVSDSGAGIAPEIRPQVFKPFFTTRKTGEGHGAGLGLYIVHELISGMSGTVLLESDENEGTRVRVRLPLTS